MEIPFSQDTLVAALSLVNIGKDAPNIDEDAPAIDWTLPADVLEIMQKLLNWA